MSRRQYRSWTAIAAIAAVTIGAAGCSGTDRHAAGTAQRTTITIGLITPETGPFKATGSEIVNGFQFYLDLHGGELGGHPVRLVVVDEGDGKQTTADSVRKLIEQERVSAVVGAVSGEATMSLRTAVTRARLPFLGTGERPSGLDDLTYLWHVSWLSEEQGSSIAAYVRTTVDGPVYVMGADCQGSRDGVAGFVKAFTALGGDLANVGDQPVWTPWPGQSVDYAPYFKKIAASGAKALYASYTGTEAVNFVKQYARSSLHGKVPLYGSGFLTDEGMLAAQGKAADGIRTTLNYAPGLDSTANRAFVTEFARHFNATPRLLNVTGYDAAMVLDTAVAAAGPSPTGEAINSRIGAIGAVDSPRGRWRWSADHAPVQTWYLRQVATDGRGRANVLVQPLAPLGSSIGNNN